jgi:hypothetical protein
MLWLSFMILPHGTNAHFGSWIHFMQSLIGARLTLPRSNLYIPKGSPAAFHLRSLWEK